MNKKMLSLILVLAVIFSFGSFAAESGTDITIVHTNDTHAKVYEGKYDGMGFAKVSEEVNNLRAANPNTILLDGGDAFHGTTFATLEKGESIVRLYTAIGYDAMVAGNHDFNYGQKKIIGISRTSKLPCSWRKC